MAGRALSDAPQPISVLMWGKEGTRKTTSALKATVMDHPGKVFLIDAEAGAKVAALRRQGVDVDRIRSWPDNPGDLTLDGLESEIEELREELSEDPTAYSTLVADSFTEIARRMTDQAAAESRERIRRTKGVERDRFSVDLADYGTSSQTMRWMLREFRDLGLHLVITALERRDEDDDGRVFYGPAVGPSVATDVMGLVDIVGWYTVETVEVGEDTEDFGIGVFATQNRRRAKDRYGILPRRMVSPTFDRIQAYIEGTMTRENDPERARLLAAMDGVRSEPDTEVPPQILPAPAEESPEQEQEEVKPATRRRRSA
jgi:hypothetical protein